MSVNAGRGEARYSWLRKELADQAADERRFITIEKRK